MKIKVFFIFYLLVAASTPLLFSQEDFKTYVDLHVGSLTIPFYTQDSTNGISYNLWEYIYYECGDEKSQEVYDKIGQNVPKFSQANFEEMVKGNVRIFSLTLSPLEHQFLENNAYINDKNKRGTLACLTGVYANTLLLKSKEVDYFQVLIQQLYFLERYQNVPHYINGKAYTYKIINTKADLEEVLNDPTKLGIILNVEGGHSLGHSVYINSLGDNTADIEVEYQDMLRRNIARLKGLLPLSQMANILVKHPVLFMSIAKTYPNGLGGTSLSYSRNQQTYINRPGEIGAASTKVGKKIIEDLVSAAGGGRPILVDIQHMSLEFRKNYYDQLDRFSLMGTEVPIIASHAGISGLPWEDALYKKKDDDSKNNNSYLNHWQQNLGQRDIEKIFEYRGIIGVTLDKTVLGGALALNKINSAVPHSTRKRNACIELFMANVLKIVQVINKKDAWDIIAIGSNFDAMQEPLDIYPSAKYLRQLHVDIQTFLDNPVNIADDLDAATIKRLRFGYSGSEIADKIMYKNSLNFIKRHLRDAPSTPPKG